MNRQFSGGVLGGLVGLLALWLPLSVTALDVAGAAARVEVFSPQGEVRGVQQISIRFSQDMVALGQADAAAPVQIDCQGVPAPSRRWLDARRWVAEFKTPLPVGTRCTARLVAGLKTLGGATLEPAGPWQFNTGGPKVVWQQPYQGSRITEQQVFLLHADAPLARDTLAGALRCQMGEQPTQAVSLLDLASTRALWQKFRGETPFEAERTVALRCAAALPAQASVQLIWGKGVTSPSGVGSGADQIIGPFQVRPEFSARLVCAQIAGVSGCDPRQSLRIEFSERVSLESLRGISLHDAQGRAIALKAQTDYDSKTTARLLESQPADPNALLPEGTTLQLRLPERLHDVDGRPLTKRAELPSAIAVATLPAYLGFADSGAVLPYRAEQPARWPLAVRRLEPSVPVQLLRIGGEMRDTASAGNALQQRARASADALALWQSQPDWPQRGAGSAPIYPVLARQQRSWAELQPQSVSGTAVESLNFVPVTLRQPGLYLLEAHSPRFADHLAAAQAARPAKPVAGLEPRASLVQVTDLNLSLRLSALGDSLLWVTSISSGLPVAGAEVDWLSCDGKLLAQGNTDAQGLMKVAARITRPAERMRCRNGHQSGLALVVRKAADLAVLSNAGANYRYGFNSDSRSHSLGYTLLDRVLFKVGETVHLQHLQRLLTIDGFALPPAGSGKLEIRFQDGSVVETQTLHWGAAGSADSQWRIPANAKLGQYRISVSGPDGQTHETGFQVEEFRVPVFDASLSGQALWQGSQQRLPLTLRLSYLAGGAAAGEAVTLQGQYREGSEAPLPGFSFSDVSLPAWQAPAFAAQPLQLDAQGQRQLDISVPALDRPATLQAEMKFSDPNGEVQTAAQRFAVWPTDVRLGVRAVAQRKPGQSRHTVALRAVLLDPKNQPLAGRALQLTAQAARWNNRSRAGSNIELIGSRRSLCSASSDARGQIECEWNDLPDKIDSGWLFAAHTVDSQGRRVNSSVLLHDYQLRWAASTEALSLAPEQSQPLAAAASAQLVINAPFTPAGLLLTVEREGVLQASTHWLTQARSTLSVPLQARFAPNVQLHGRFVRPLTERPATTAPGRAGPAAAEAALPLAAEHQLALKIAPDRFALDLTLTPEQTQLRPGGSTRIGVMARQRSGGAPAAHARVTLVAVDEALLALKDNPTWDVLAALLRDRAIGVQGSALDALIRLQLGFGPQPGYWPPDDQAERVLLQRPSPAAMMAAAPAPPPAPEAAGGALRDRAAKAARNDRSSSADVADSAAADAVRSDFSSLALWRTDLVLDAQGRASVPVTFNDSLTRWRIVAIALGDADRFGHGQTHVAVSQPLQLYSGLPPLLRSGDQLKQAVTLRNNGSTPLTLQLTAQATLQMAADAVPGPACVPTSSRQHNCAGPTAAQDAIARGLSLQRSLSLAAGQAQELSWPVAVPAGVERIDWQISAVSSDGRERDALQLSQRVIAALPVTVQQATLVQIKGQLSLPVARPSQAQPGQGGVQISLSDSLVRSALQGVRQWMADYPYACLEQKASKLVVAGDAAGWASLMTELPKYLDAQGLARYFNESTLSGSESLTAYLLDVAQAQNWPIPTEPRQKMLKALQKALQQPASALDWQPWRSPVSTQARQLALQATLALQGQISDESALTLRPDDLSTLPTLALADWARTLLALPASVRSNTDLQQAAQQLRARYDVQGTRLNWRSDARDAWWWWMWSGDVAMARSVLVVQQWLGRDAAWQADLPLLVQGLVARQQQGRWSTTVANVWGSIALQRFAASVEAGPVTGQTTLALAGATPAKVNLNWPQPATTLLRPAAGAGTGTLQLSHQGSGAPWANVAITAAVRLQQPRQAGLQVEKTITPVEQKRPGQWSVGDVARITLKLQSQAEATWVVVHDPVPSGSTILGRGLGRESQLAQQGQRSSGWAWPSFIERAADSYRGYYRWVPKGNWSVDYSVRLNNAGTFELPATRAEVLYAPEIFGESPNAVWVVLE